MFDTIAPRYDFLNHLLSAGIDRRWRRRAIRALNLTGKEQLLDLCAGTGDLAIAALEARPAAARAIGVDFAGGMLRMARHKVGSAHLAGAIALVRGDATRIPLADRSVDRVAVAFGIRNVEDTRAACGEIYRVLGPGGRVAILEFAIPTAPLFRHVYLWYFNRILPRVGRLISKDGAAYGYLPASVASFPSPDEFVILLRHCGFVDVVCSPLTLGIVYLYVARIPG
jgi:demethylmenaquinone methyltransferase/2-methoxy-6-polyprenyl-1,4-benzoquinol methylase